MKKFLTLIAWMCLFTSCTKKMDESLVIRIENKTDAVLYFVLEPHEQSASTPNTLYRVSDIGGQYLEREFELSSFNDFNKSRMLFNTTDLTIEPHVLVSKIFNGIRIYSADQKTQLINFTRDTVVGYSENIFTISSTWNYEVVESDRVTQTRRNSARYHVYTFSILENKIIVE